MDVTPAISTRYRAYLQSEGWRITRNRALKIARYTCQRCGARRNVQVHHRTYERLGCEVDGDLEVLCRDCHEGHHVQEMHDAGGEQRLYLKIANDVLRAHPFDTIADLSDAVKTECARLKIKPNHHHIEKALGLICGTSFGAERTHLVEEIVIAGAAGRAPTHQEAVEFLHVMRNAGIALDSLIKPMPRAKTAKIDIYGPIPRDDDWGEHDRY
jgi:hypothetical protein